MFSAFRVEQTDTGFQGQWQSVERTALPEGDVEIEVQYSSVNYKDALSYSGNRGVTRDYPHTPGIDAAGRVVNSEVDEFSAGDEVVVFGYDLGMNTDGGFAQRIRVPASWVLRLPPGLSCADAMAWGTAGFTAALSVMKLERNGIAPSNGPVVVTGATGGVGSVAVALLARLGYSVAAVSGKAEQSDFLSRLGATSVVSRDDILAVKGKAMARTQYQAAVDTVGGDLVAALVPQIHPEGAVTTCGMIAGTHFDVSVFPFILRGVSVLGVDSVEIPRALKQAVLDKAASDWSLPLLNELVTDIGRSELSKVLDALLQGQGVGRYRLDLSRD
ncbi:oxidoreductase [Bacterioplanes sanyensis]|uniref:YhdH/YhfP family quinone oxidoreductase n=1 Tax=Bacterioplanes sanyensis TaxID=1249553 RepID=UPI001671E486|nr:YhdH/YhfP family quinone oxidoreductase [Bacterioplanes sanyensis]GGY40901.1 oxidoreductase [Bacterioplanes sanyensis]